MKTLLALILLFAVNVQGQILVYKRSINRITMGNGFTTKQTVNGYLIVNAATGSAAEFDIDSRAKEYLVRSKTFAVSTVRGGPGKDYLVLAEWLTGTDALGPYKFSSTLKGINVPLNIGFMDKRLVPKTMRSIGRDVFNMGIEPFIDEETGTLAIDIARMQSANSSGQTVDDVRVAIVAELTAKGYEDAHP